MKIKYSSALITALAIAACAAAGWAQPGAGSPNPGAAGTCRADEEHYCAGGQTTTLDEVEQCLVLHIKELSEQCRAHLIEMKAVAPEVVGSGEAVQICQPDQVRFCPEFSLSDHTDAAYECLGRHMKELSPGCQPQVQAAQARAEQNALTKVVIDCKVETAGFCKGLPLRGFLFLDCLLINKKKASEACQTSVEAAKRFRQDLKEKYKGPSRPWWKFW